MTNRIRNYKDLLEEKARLEFLLAQQKDEFRSNMQTLKEDYSPLFKFGSAIGMLTTRNYHYPLLNFAAGMMINNFVKNKLLARAGWIVRLLVPFLMKNVSSHVIKKRAGQLFSKINELVSKN